MVKGGFYGVARTPTGRGVGIHKEWSKAKPHCIDPKTGKPFKEAVFKKFGSMEEAKKFVGEKCSLYYAFFDHANGKKSDVKTAANLESYIRENRLYENLHNLDVVQRSLKGEAETWLTHQAKQEKALATPPLLPVENSTTVLLPQNSTAPNADAEGAEAAAVLASPAVDKGMGFYYDEDDELVVNTDGACPFNGTDNSQAGYGIWFGDHDPRNECGRLPWGPDTNQRAELYAILRALQKTQSYICTVVIRSDSDYAIKCLTEWIKTWLTNGWRASNGRKPVSNLDIIKPAYGLIQARYRLYGTDSLVFEHVRSHAGDHGNAMADRLAVRGAQLG